MKLELHIGELVLRGFDPGLQHEIRAEVERELAALLRSETRAAPLGGGEMCLNWMPDRFRSNPRAREEQSATKSPIPSIGASCDEQNGLRRHQGRSVAVVTARANPTARARAPRQDSRRRSQRRGAVGATAPFWLCESARDTGAGDAAETEGGHAWRQVRAGGG